MRDTAIHLLEMLAAQGAYPVGICADSRNIAPRELFLAFPGALSDGRRFIADAAARGAAAVLWEKAGFAWDETLELAHLPVDGLPSLAGHLAHELCGRPSEKLWLAGVTGTNGKTSVSQWLAVALTLLGMKCAVVGTLGNGFPGHLAASVNTTPDAVALHRALSGFLAQGAQAAVMEVSSIGLHQGRVNGAAFNAAAFTNLSRDHLDYHGTLEAYAATKALLFETAGLECAVLNLDDAFGRDMAGRLSGSGVRRIGYSLEGAGGTEETVQARDIAATARGQRFTLCLADQEIPVEVALVGRFNLENLLCVAGLLRAAGFGAAEIAGVLPRLLPPAGRMQMLGGEGEPLVVVDYAHTPDALAKVLAALRPTAEARGGKLTCVFGCGGNRDKGKRPLMGQVAARLADRVLLTSDNPRGENPGTILKEIHAGAPAAEVIADRGEAIRTALLDAVPEDVVLLAGKGHETYQETAGKRVHFSDMEQAANGLAAREGVRS
ncbi:MAG: UDP-N-acetylmuramoyl-L-alanyl-D-glutamate--2,6-diaminopimelate ligase [Rhodocyclaceae bacterium]|nr:UDP-N-acetylmuramoyl-L-alanyl-D-glutamate--2,6-diaminopimelate ligase [Rhodocyclaceae bacterium]